MPPAGSRHEDPAAAAPLAGAGSPADDTPAPSQRGRWIAAVQVVVGLALLGLLGWQAAASDTLAELAGQRPHAGWLAASVGMLVLSVLGSFVRWRLVAAAAGLPLSLADAVRLGAIGFAANFVALGNIGGDVVKAAMLAHRRPGRRALALTTVVVDRAMGLFALLVLATLAIVAGGALTGDLPLAARVVCRSTLGVTAIALVCFFAATAPGRPLLRLAYLVRSTPKVGRWLAEAALLADAYRNGRRSIYAALAVGLVTDVAFVGSFYAVARSLPLAAPGLVDHFFVVPLGLIAGALPISPSGLGTVEAMVDLLYRALEPAASPGSGAIVGFGHRLVMLTVGGVAVLYYLGTRDKRFEVGG